MADVPADLIADLEAYYASAPRTLGSAWVAKDGRPDPGPQTSPPTHGLPDELYGDRATIVLALRLDGFSYDEIATKTGLSKEQIRYACRKARTAGKLRDVIDLIDNEAVPQAVDNLNAMLQDSKHPSHEMATFETLKGRGAFRRFSGDKIGGGGLTAGIPPLQINILTPSGGELPTVIVNSDRGAVIGAPREDAD